MSGAGGNSERHRSCVFTGVWIVLWVLLALQGSESPWIDSTGHLSSNGRDALVLLTGSAKDGLDPEQYDASALQAAAARLALGTPSANQIATFDAALDASMRRYFQHLHAGRVEPRSVGFKMAAHPPEDFGERLRAAVANHRLAAAAEELTPAMPAYRELRAALAKYRALAADSSLMPPALPSSSIHAGDRCVELARLRHLLVALGDLPAYAGGGTDPSIYDEGLVEGVRHFQRRHGLEPDGVIGKSVRTALQVPLAWRVRQIELAMERLRWLPDRKGQRLLAVNIPMFRLWAVEGTAPAFSTEVIVGRALETRTPVFVEALEAVIFRPYWNVPPSILRHEILPALARDPAYLRKHDMEFVRDGDGLRVRQRPGPANSLGLVKFAFPNSDNVYMHGTPVPALFNRARRDFSHGCIRVADPIGLAEWVLAPEGGWTRERILAAMNGSESTQVTLATPIAVVLFYVTAVVVPGDGTLHFADDIYGHDARLHRALERICGSKT